MPDIPNQYRNSALTSSRSVSHEDRVKVSFSQLFNKMTRGYYAMSMLFCKPVLIGDRVNLFSMCEN